MIDFSKNYSVHFVGIGGVSMHALAMFCNDLGWQVSGSDVKKNKYVNACRSKGIKVYISHKKENVPPCNFIVKTGAIADNNPEIEYAKKLGIKIYDRADFLGEVTKQFPLVIGVAGSHGKSTTTAMIEHILRADNRKVSCHIGADVENARLNLNDDILVVEACEFNKTFLKLKLDVACVLNVENDHMDCYHTMYQLKNSFKTFLKHAKKRFILDNDTTKYIDLINTDRLPTVKYCGGKFFFKGEKYIFSEDLGEQYAYDAIMAIAVCKDLGVNYHIIYNALKTFQPLPRRRQVVGKYKNTELIIDYAHHPTEIKYLIENFKKDKPLFVFQPHTFSRTKYLKNEFLEVLRDIDLIVFKEYSARETSDKGLSAHQLFDELKNINPLAIYAENLNDILNQKQLEHYTKILFVGAGDINDLANQLTKIE